MKLPENFNLGINLKEAIMSAAAVVLFFYTLNLTAPGFLIAGAIFGFCGGSVSDLIAFNRNKAAIALLKDKLEEKKDNEDE